MDQPENRRYYWATEPDQERLIHDCADKIKEYGDSLRQSWVYPKILRNYLYYHGLYYRGSLTDYSSLELKRLGEQGKYVGFAANLFRHFIQHILSLVASQRPAFQTIAVNSKEKSLRQARHGDNLLEWRVEKHRDSRYWKRALEHAFIFLGGYSLLEWDPDAGPETESMGQPIEDPETGQLTPVFARSGEPVYSNPTIFDVAHDFSVRHWDDNEWFMVRRFKNKWNLLAKYPEAESEILNENTELEDQYSFRRTGAPLEKSDFVPTWTFYHKRTPALPDGRRFEFIGKKPLTDEPLPYPDIPLDRMAPADTLLYGFGYSPACDLQAPQEAYNGDISSIATNHKTFGVQNVWAQSGEKVYAERMEGGLQLVRSRVKPEGINLTATPAEYFKFPEMIERIMESVSGINSVRRGQAEANLRSARALALIEAKAYQFAAPAEEEYVAFIERQATKILWMYNYLSVDGMNIVIPDKSKRSSSIEIRRGGLNDVDRVIVKVGDPMTRTAAGRMELLSIYSSLGLITTPEEVLNVIETGRLEVATEAMQKQLEIVREENDRLQEYANDPRAMQEIVISMQLGMRMQMPLRAIRTDYHLLHIREHTTLLNSTEVRNSPLSVLVEAHIMEHEFLISDPMVQAQQQLLGYGMPMAPVGQPLGAQQGGPINKPKPQAPGEDRVEQEAEERSNVNVG